MPNTIKLDHLCMGCLKNVTIGQKLCRNCIQKYNKEPNTKLPNWMKKKR